MKLKELALMLGGELRGEPDIDIRGAATSVCQRRRSPSSDENC